MEKTETINNPKEAKEYFENKIKFTLGPAELKTMQDDNKEFNLIDVRATEDFEKGHIPGAINLPKGEWSTLKGLSTDRQNIVYCYTAVCHLAANAAYFFANKGFPVMEMEGGMKAWRQYGYNISSETKKMSA